MDDLSDVAHFGQNVQEFLLSPIGRYLAGRAQEEADTGLELLWTVAPWRTRRIRQLQNQVQVAEWFQQWLGNAVADGLNAQQILED